MDTNFILSGGFAKQQLRKAWGSSLNNAIECTLIDLERAASIIKVIRDNLDEIEEIYRNEGGNNGDSVVGETNEREFFSWVADNLEELYMGFK